MSGNPYLPATKVIPGTLLITNITNEQNAVVTFTDSDLNTYIVGQCIQFFVQPEYGMAQIDGQIGQILSIDSNNFTVNINTSDYDIFTIPSLPPGKPASFAPAGSRNLTYDNTARRVAFQNLNNMGN